jgi:two-component system, LytTR family, sensor kinase
MAKQPNYLKRLFNAALITSPIIAILLVTPLYLVGGLQIAGIELLLPLAIIIVFVVWCIHILFISFFPSIKKWQRLLIIITIGLIVSTIVFEIINLQLPYALWKVHIARSLNVISINSIVFILSNFILLNQTKKELDIENQELKFANLEARYQTLKNQINPHFLFNAIGTAKSLIRKNPAIADEYLVKLSDFLRLGFDSKLDTISVAEELALCEDYIALQKMRFGNALQFVTNIEAKYLTHLVPYFALLSLVENAVKHNNMTEREPLIIAIRNDTNLLIVENNLQKKVLLETSSKTGLSNLIERYRLLFNETVNIEHTANHFMVSIKMIHK